MALLEREKLLAALSGHLALALRGHGQMILLRGEAGIGKTAALDKFAEGARGSADVVFGACDPLNTPRPLGSVLDIASGARRCSASWSGCAGTVCPRWAAWAGRRHPLVTWPRWWPSSGLRRRSSWSPRSPATL